jgi:hypothetical protein
MLPSFAKETVTIVRPSWVDERGKQIPDYENPAETVTLANCSVQPGATSEVLEGRQNSTIRFSLYAPPGTVIGAQDAVIYDGVRYAVDGAGQSWKSPTGAVSHVVAALVDWEG